MNLYDFTVKTRKGADVALSDFAGKVVLVVGNITDIRTDPYPRSLGHSQPDTVMQSHGLHDHPKLMIAVRAPSQHVQTDIDLCVCSLCHRHRHKLYSLRFLYTIHGITIE